MNFKAFLKFSKIQ